MKRKYNSTPRRLVDVWVKRKYNSAPFVHATATGKPRRCKECGGKWFAYSWPAAEKLVCLGCEE